MLSSVVKLLSERGFAFRWENEELGPPENEHFLGIMELIEQFDPFTSNDNTIYHPVNGQKIT